MLYQQGSQKIEVIVRKQGGGAGLAGTNEKDIDDNETNDSSLGEQNNQTGLSRSELRRRRRIITNTTHGIAVTRQAAALTVNYLLTGLGFKEGDQAYQDQVQRSFEIYRDVTAMASSVSMGAVYGAWGGPVGSALGALFGALGTSASLAAKYLTRGRDYDIKMFKENNSIQYSRARAGINETNGRLR